MLRLRFRSDSFCRTYVCARAAVGASRRVDNVNITGRDCSYRTFVDTGAAGNAGIGTDFVSHGLLFD